jgi:hypothetical protein
MSVSRLEALTYWLFGEEGDIILNREIQMIMVVTGVGVSGIFVVSPILSDLTGTLQVTDAEIGLLMTMFTAPSIMLVPVMGMLADRIGRRPVLTGGLLVFGVAGTSVALVDTFTAVVALRVLQGVAMAGIAPVSVTLLGDLYSGAREATAQGLRFTGVGVAQAAVPPVGRLTELGPDRYLPTQWAKENTTNHVRDPGNHKCRQPGVGERRTPFPDGAGNGAPRPRRHGDLDTD